MALTCPRCRVAMTEQSAVTAAGPTVTVDICGECKGLWLDAQKLASVCPTVSDLPSRKAEILVIGEPGANIPVCPRCAAVPYEFAVMPDMLIDFCPRCSGVWLDGDEYEEGSFEPVADERRPGDQGPYRAAAEKAEKRREVTCQDCAKPVVVAVSYVWEHGFLCHPCFIVKQERQSKLRVARSEDPVGRLIGDVLTWLLPVVDPRDRGPR